MLALEPPLFHHPCYPDCRYLLGDFVSKAMRTTRSDSQDREQRESAPHGRDGRIRGTTSTSSRSGRSEQEELTGTTTRGGTDESRQGDQQGGVFQQQNSSLGLFGDNAYISQGFQSGSSVTNNTSSSAALLLLGGILAPPQQQHQQNQAPPIVDGMRSSLTSFLTSNHSLGYLETAFGMPSSLLFRPAQSSYFGTPPPDNNLAPAQLAAVLRAREEYYALLLQNNSGGGTSSTPHHNIAGGTTTRNPLDISTSMIAPMIMDGNGRGGLVASSSWGQNLLVAAAAAAGGGADNSSSSSVEQQGASVAGDRTNMIGRGSGESAALAGAFLALHQNQFPSGNELASSSTSVCFPLDARRSSPAGTTSTIMSSRGGTTSTGGDIISSLLLTTAKMLPPRREQEEKKNAATTTTRGGDGAKDSEEQQDPAAKVRGGQASRLLQGKNVAMIRSAGNDDYDGDDATSSSNKDQQGRSSVLYLDGDEHYLTDYQCLLRKQLEVFEAGPNDLRGSTQGRNVQIVIGQVGLRCRHCANLPLAARTKGAVYFSQTVEGMYQIAQNMSKVHLCQRCYRIPPHVQNKLVSLKNDSRRATGGKEYWTKGLANMGVYEDGKILRMKKAPPPPPPPTAAKLERGGVKNDKSTNNFL